jgi:outer membrane assembly lipoprotein YfiO
MRPIVRYFLICFILLYSWGCGQKSAKLQKSVVPPDKTLFETGSDYLKKSQYIKARLAFQTLINTYPDSDMAADSYFAIGDSFYDEGGTENLLQAEDQFRNFIVFFPTSPKAPDAQLKIISAMMKSMHAPDRDQQNSERAEREIKKFLDQFPDSDYVPIVRGYLDDVQEVLAKRDFGVGQFYADKGSYAGAKGRFQDIIDKYKNFSGTDETLFLLASVLEKSNNPDEAAIYYGKITSAYPFSKRFEEAKERLNLLGKPVPPVDTQSAALNQSKLKPAEGFSPLKPFIDFGKALGFVGTPDRYELAKKTVEEEKAKSVEAAASAKTGEGGTDGIQIETTIRKNASGETQTSTVLSGGSGSTSSQQSDEDKKKPANNKNRKKKAS